MRYFIAFILLSITSISFSATYTIEIFNSAGQFPLTYDTYFDVPEDSFSIFYGTLKLKLKNGRTMITTLPFVITENKTKTNGGK